MVSSSRSPSRPTEQGSDAGGRWVVAKRVAAIAGSTAVTVLIAVAVAAWLMAVMIGGLD